MQIASGALFHKHSLFVFCQLSTSRIFVDTTHARDGGHHGVRPGRRAPARMHPGACVTGHACERARAGSGPRATGRASIEARRRGADYAWRHEKERPGVLSRGGQEVQRGPSEEIREISFRGRGSLVRARPRRLRRALRGTRHRDGHRGHPHRVKTKNAREKKKKTLSRRVRVPMNRRRASPFRTMGRAARRCTTCTRHARTRRHTRACDARVFTCAVCESPRS